MHQNLDSETKIRFCQKLYNFTDIHGVNHPIISEEQMTIVNLNTQAFQESQNMLTGQKSESPY